jgi:ATP-binding cassette subfamily B protein
MRLIRPTSTPTLHDVSLLERRYRGEAPLKTYLVLYKGDWHNLTLAMLFFIIKHSGVWAMPVITARIVDIIAQPENGSLTGIVIYSGLAALIFLQNIPVNWLFTLRLSTANRNMETKLRSAMARRLQYLSMNFYHRSRTGVLHTKMLRDVELLQDLTMQLSQTLPAAAFTLLFALAITAIRVPVFLIFYALTVPLAVLLTHWMRRPLQSHNRDFRQQVEAMSSGISEMLQLAPITRAHGLEDTELRRLEGRLWDVRHAGLRLDAINALFGASAWVSFRLFEVLCLVVAAIAAYTQIIPITVGDVVMVTAFFTNLTNSVLAITNILPQITRGFESIHSIGELLESPDVEENDGKRVVESVGGGFTFEHVSFAYPDTADSSIMDFSLKVHPGETIAFVGASGAGKSTLLNLIIGYIRPTAGRLLLDNVDMNTLDLRTYRRFLSVVPQQTVLFDGTLRENILYGVPHVREAELERVLRAANIYDFLDDLPDGLETYLGEGGARLSGGQKQRVSIARALIRNPRVLILDEATSALDTVSEREVQEALSHLMRGRTTFVVAHRLSTIRNADRIVVLNEGRIVAIGKHDELIQSQNLYTDMLAAFQL